MTALHAIHDTVRTELAHIARATAMTGDDPGLATAWRPFKQLLHLHLTTEDEALWPVLRRTLAARSAELVLLEAVEAEHAALRQVVEMIDTLLADPDRDPGRLGDLTGSLATGLSAHLAREEAQLLPLVRRFLTTRQWAYFGRLHAARLAAAARS